jgi:hypothetical protein
MHGRRPDDPARPSAAQLAAAALQSSASNESVQARGIGRSERSERSASRHDFIQYIMCNIHHILYSI